MAGSVLPKYATKKIADPSLTSPFVEPYHKCAFDKILSSDAMFQEHSLQSLQTSTEHLKNELNITAEDNGIQVDYSLKRNGFKTPEDYVLVGGDGVMSICLNLHQHGESDQHDIVIYYHTTQKIEPLGYLPIHGYYSNFGFVDGRWGCCVHEPGVLCQLSQNGDFMVIFGPREFARGSSLAKDAPVLLVYHVSPAQLLFKKNCKKISFVKCDAMGISICPKSIKEGQYRIALVTESMEIRLWNATTAHAASLQLESVKPCVFNCGSYSNPSESCIKFSNDGRCLSVLCFMATAKKCACLILNVDNLEPLCWMAFNEGDTWLRWLFPIFSSCGTEVILSTYWNSHNEYDLTKYEMLFHKLPFVNESLKFLCRVVILQHVKPSLISELPLSSDLIVFLGGSMQYESVQSSDLGESVETKLRCKCVNM